MIRPNSDVTSLLAAAIGLVHAPRPESFDTIQIGGSRFRFISKYHEQAGWVVVLIQEESVLSDERLKLCYGLSRREIQVARLLAQRQSNREIAEQLYLAVSTVRRHTESVLRKLGIASRKDVRDKLLS
jgi:DNA-binding NarL/FixJ family response regulator